MDRSHANRGVEQIDPMTTAARRRQRTSPVTAMNASTRAPQYWGTVPSQPVRQAAILAQRHLLDLLQQPALLHQSVVAGAEDVSQCQRCGALAASVLGGIHALLLPPSPYRMSSSAAAQ